MKNKEKKKMKKKIEKMLMLMMLADACWWWWWWFDGQQRLGFGIRKSMWLTKMNRDGYDVCKSTAPKRKPCSANKQTSHICNNFSNAPLHPVRVSPSQHLAGASSQDSLQWCGFGALVAVLCWQLKQHQVTGQPGPTHLQLKALWGQLSNVRDCTRRDHYCCSSPSTVASLALSTSRRLVSCFLKPYLAWCSRVQPVLWCCFNCLYLLSLCFLLLCRPISGILQLTWFWKLMLAVGPLSLSISYAFLILLMPDQPEHPQRACQSRQQATHYQPWKPQNAEWCKWFRLFEHGFPIPKLCVRLGIITSAIASEGFVTSGLKMPCFTPFGQVCFIQLPRSIQLYNLQSVDRDLPPAAVVFIG